MNYVWEAVLTTEEGAISREELRFVPAFNPSPYVEVSFAEINTTTLDEPQVAVNPLYRFQSIFENLFGPDMQEYENTRGIFLDVIMHYMANTDLLSGMHRQEYHYWFLLEELQRGIFGQNAAEVIGLFAAKEKRLIVTSLLGLYRSAHYKEIFIQLVKGLYENAIVYAGRDRAEDTFIYLGTAENKIERKKIGFLVDTFLPLSEHVTIFYDKHFGIIDLDETMQTDKILLI